MFHLRWNIWRKRLALALASDKSAALLADLDSVGSETREYKV